MKQFGGTKIDFFKFTMKFNHFCFLLATTVTKSNGFQYQVGEERMFKKNAVKKEQIGIMVLL